MKKPIRISKGVDALQLPTSFVMECMADADSRLNRAHLAFEEYQHPDGHVICIFAVADEIFAFTKQEAALGPFGDFRTMGIADVRKFWRYLKGAEA